MTTTAHEAATLKLGVLEALTEQAVNNAVRAHRRYKADAIETQIARARRSALFDAYAAVTERDRDAVSEEFHLRWENANT